MCIAATYYYFSFSQGSFAEVSSSVALTNASLKESVKLILMAEESASNVD